MAQPKKGAYGPARNNFGPGLSLGEFVAKVSIRCGIPIERAVEMSLCQLITLDRAQSRIQAVDDMRMIDAVRAAVAGVMSSEGARACGEFRKQLEFVANEHDEL